MNKKILAIVGGIVLILLIAGGSFYGGVVFQRSQAANIRASFFTNRGGGEGGFPGGGGNGGGGNFLGGGNSGGGNGGRGGAVGQIKSIDGNTFTLSTPQSEVKVTLTDATQIQKLVAGDRTDLQTGESIVVRGTSDSSGNITADSIQIANNP